jgi:hypothetical protein
MLLGSVSYAQEIEPTQVPVTVTEGGDSNSILQVIRAELQPLGLLILFSALGTGAWAIIEALRVIRNRNVERFAIVLDGVEFVVTKITPFTEIDNRLFFFFRKRIERPTPTTIEELRDDLNRSNR